MVIEMVKEKKGMGVKIIPNSDDQYDITVLIIKELEISGRWILDTFLQDSKLLYC